VTLTFDEFELDPDRLELRRDGEPVALEPQAFDVLVYLIEQRERVVPKDELLEAVWASQFVSDSAVTTRIKEVRQALGDDGRTQRYVRTVRGRGYHFVGAASESGETVTSDSADSTARERGVEERTPPLAVPLPTDSFVGRVSELGRLRRAVDESIDGRGGVAMLVGEAGIGKTRTTQELEAYAVEQGARVLWGRVRQASGAPPYYPWIQIGTHYGREADVAALDLGPNAGELVRLFPNLATRLPGIELSVAPEGPTAQFRMFEGYSAFLRAAAAQQPLMVVLEDLHWADEPTLALLQHLSPELATMPLLVVGTYRDTDINDAHPLTSALAQLNREAAFLRMHLDGLSGVEVADYVRRYPSVELGRPMVEHVHQRTDGNPFFVGQLVQLLSEQGPDAGDDDAGGSTIALPAGVREALIVRLDQLSPAAHSALQVAAVCGRTFDLSTLEAVGDDSADAVLRQVEEALAAHIIEEFDEPGRYRFVHALMQETLLDQLSATRRARAHGAVAEALEAAYGDQAAGEAARLAEHFAESARLNRDHVERTLGYLELAAAQAMAQSAWTEAVELYERCLTVADGAPEFEVDAASIRFALGRAQLYLNLPRPAWRNLLTALDAFRARGDWELAADAAARASDVLAPPERIVAVLSTVIDGEGTVSRTRRAGLLVKRAMSRFRASAPAAEWRQDIEEAEALIDGVDQPRVVGRLLRVRGALDRLEHGTGQRERFLEAADAFDEAGDAESAGEALWQAVNEPRRVGELEHIDPTLERHLDYARRNGLRRWLHVGQYFRVRMAVLRGERATAESLIDADMPEYSHLTYVARASLAELQPWPPSDLEPLLARPELAGGDPFQMTAAYGSRLRLNLLAGRVEEAARDEAGLREQIGDRLATEGPSGLFLEGGDVLAELQDETFVAWCRDWLEAQSQHFAGDTGTFANMRGRIALRLGDLDAARGHLEQAVLDATRAGWPVDLGRAHQALAELAAREGDEEGATAHRAEAARRFEAHGAQVFLDQLNVSAGA